MVGCMHEAQTWRSMLLGGKGVDEAWGPEVITNDSVLVPPPPITLPFHFLVSGPLLSVPSPKTICCNVVGPLDPGLVTA